MSSSGLKSQSECRSYETSVSSSGLKPKPMQGQPALGYALHKSVKRNRAMPIARAIDDEVEDK